MRIALGVTLVCLAAAAFPFAVWLNQPGFAGDPRVKLLDDGPFALVVVVLLAVAAGGVAVARSARRRGKMGP